MNAQILKAAIVGAVLLLALTLTPTRPARASDHIFPAAPAAKAFSDFDSRGFLINGKRTFLVSAGMEYARVPRALWRDRLLRLKRAGFNCIEMYNFWNWHEPQEGKFDFTGDHDLDAFLKLIKSLDMYAICRVGPYYCAEWDNGGYPLWLNFKPGIQVRTDDPVFEAAVDKFWDKLLPIVAANQINHGGSVVLVQLENEHPQAWGTDVPNPYFKHLQDKAVALGIQVPYFFSGLHHGSDPAGNAANLDDPTRPNPWFTTEFWSVWYDHYGPGPTDPATYDRRTWKIIAHGGNGYNYYMAHGGSNFAYTNNDEDAASYDYGAAVGQAGDLRPLYYTFKRAAWFARSFQDVLENSIDDTTDYKNAATNSAVQVTARRSMKDRGPDGQWMPPAMNPDPGGTILFLDNPTDAPVQTQVNDATGQPYSATPLTLAPGELRPIVRDYPLPTVPGVTIQSALTRLYAIIPQGDTTTIILTGAPGTPVDISFVAPTAKGQGQGGDGPHQTPLQFLPPTAVGVLNLAGTIPANGPATGSFTVGTKHVRILAIPDALADCTWPIDVAGQTYIICGPAYIGDAKMTNGKLTLTTEQPWQDADKFGLNYTPLAYGPGDTPIRLTTNARTANHAPSLTLGAWQTLNGSQPAAPAFNDASWMTSPAPLPMGADGDDTADAWYRVKLPVVAAGTYTLQLGRVRDRSTTFLDGKPLPAAPGGPLPVTLTAGAHTLAVFAAHDGRDKLVGYLGALDKPSLQKGLLGPALLLQGAVSGPALTDWRVLLLARSPRGKIAVPAADAPGWTDYTVGADAFSAKPGTAWFQTTLPGALGAGGGSLHLESVDDNATMFLNGKNIGQHTGWDQPFDVPLGAAWKTDGPNVLTILVQNTAGTGGIDKPVSLTTYTSQIPITGWALRGGPGDPLAATGWKPLGAVPPVAAPAPLSLNGPQFYRTTFIAAPPPAVGPHPIWRVVTTGLGHGNVWVNGHNLGRYPEKIPVNGLYIPECWLTTGANSLVIYDEDGQRPDGVTLEAETAASRDVVELTATGP